MSKVKSRKALLHICLALLGIRLQWLISSVGNLIACSAPPQFMDKARIRQRALTLLDLKNTFGEVQHNLVFEALKYHHIPNHIRNLIRNLFNDFHTLLSHHSSNLLFFIKVVGFFKVIALAPCCLIFVLTLSFNKSKKKNYSQFGFSTSYDPGSSFVPIHWFQFSDNAAVISGHEQESQILLNRFYLWCKWAGMHIRVDKCATFGIREQSTRSIQFQPKLIVTDDLVLAVKIGDSFRYLRRYFDFNMSKK